MNVYQIELVENKSIYRNLLSIIIDAAGGPSAEDPFIII